MNSKWQSTYVEKEICTPQMLSLMSDIFTNYSKDSILAKLYFNSKIHLKKKKSTNLLRDPANNKQAIAFLISTEPKIDGAILLVILSSMFGLLARNLNVSSSSGVNERSVERPAPSVTTEIPITLM